MALVVPALPAVWAGEHLWRSVGLGLALTAALLAAVVLSRPAAPPAELKQWQAAVTARGAACKYSGRRMRPVEIPFASYVGMCGVVGGLAVTEPLAWAVPLATPAGPLAAALRVVVGFVVLFGVFLGVRAVEKKVARGAFVLRFCRYAAVAPLIVLVAPALFLAMGV